jgi:hypothetical protein
VLDFNLAQSVYLLRCILFRYSQARVRHHCRLIHTPCRSNFGEEKRAEQDDASQEKMTGPALEARAR